MMAARRASFTQSDLTKVLKAFRDAGQPMPQIVLEPERITATPVGSFERTSEPNPWDS
jgi:hypothetical protein